MESHWPSDKTVQPISFWLIKAAANWIILQCTWFRWKKLKWDEVMQMSDIRTFLKLLTEYLWLVHFSPLHVGNITCETTYLQVMILFNWLVLSSSKNELICVNSYRTTPLICFRHRLQCDTNLLLIDWIIKKTLAYHTVKISLYPQAFCGKFSIF